MVLCYYIYLQRFKTKYEVLVILVYESIIFNRYLLSQVLSDMREAL